MNLIDCPLDLSINESPTLILDPDPTEEITVSPTPVKPQNNQPISYQETHLILAPDSFQQH